MPTEAEMIDWLEKHKAIVPFTDRWKVYIPDSSAPRIVEYGQSIAVADTWREAVGRAMERTP
jgi:hypothetical protein